MQFLADGGISPATVDFLRHQAHAAVHIRTLGMQRATDRDIVDRARREGWVILAFDLDFGDILAAGVLEKPSVVLFRLNDERPAAVNQRLSTVLAERLPDLEAGALILVEDRRYRVRKLPFGRS